MVLNASVTKSLPHNILTWSIDDNTDLLQVGYLGSLTFESLTLVLPQPCCITASLIGNWYFDNQPLPWNIFGTILPGAFGAQAVIVPQLNAPAYLTLRNVSIVYVSCDISFAAAANLLISDAKADSQGSVQVNASFINQTFLCTTCMFQGSEQVPSIYGNHVSQVQLYDTSIVCLNADTGSAPANSSNTTIQNITTGATARASWAPHIWLPIFLTIVTCIAVALALSAWLTYLRRPSQATQNTSIPQATNRRQHV